MEVALHYPHSSGTVAANLQVLARAQKKSVTDLLSKYHPELPCPTHAVDARFGYVFEHFRRLDARRAAGFTGANPLTYQDLRTYSDMYGIRLSEWEVDTILALDDARLAQVAEEQQKGRSQ